MKDIREIVPGLKDAGYPLEGIATGGQPEEEHFERLAEAGYKTVLDLRASDEDRGLDERDTVLRSGMEYVNMPVGHETVDDETFDRFRELMADSARRPVLVHCSSANRVGALLIPYLLLDEGRTFEEAEKIAYEVGLKSYELKEAARRYSSRRR